MKLEIINNIKKNNLSNNHDSISKNLKKNYNNAQAKEKYC